MNALHRRAGWHGCRTATLGAFAGSMLLIAACNSAQNTMEPNTSAAAAAVQHPMLAGIPVPREFSFVPERSRGRESGQYRDGYYFYQGDLDPTRVIRFYSENMPASGYELKQRRLHNGQYTLRFDSDREECNVTVARESLKTTLVIDIVPQPRGNAERERPPTAPARRRPPPNEE